ncbi:hypothetical protein WJX74_006040 [Apatococcus lobatus]|uniref:Uncharacterized protein n=1 Tax=Apatococcus lobatus TaxID=904363 RepID=A0AAW1RAQ4_9CHLO
MQASGVHADGFRRPVEQPGQHEELALTDRLLDANTMHTRQSEGASNRHIPSQQPQQQAVGQPRALTTGLVLPDEPYRQPATACCSREAAVYVVIKMVRFSVSAELGMPAHLFFVERDSAAFRSLVAKVMKLGALDIAEGWMEGGVEVYKFVTDPDMDKYVPRSLQHHLAGGKITYTDIIRYDPKLIASAPFKLPVESIPPVFSNRATIHCTLLIEEVDEHRCRQTLEGEVKLNIFGLGAIAERIIADSLKKVYSGIPPIVERWKAFREEILQQPNGHEVLVKGRPDNQGVDWISDQIRDLLKAEVGPRLQTQASAIDISHMPSPEVPPAEQPTDAETHRPSTVQHPATNDATIDGAHHSEVRAQELQREQQQASHTWPTAYSNQPHIPNASHDRSLAAEHHLDPSHNAHPQAEGEDTFFDAEEDWQWADEMPCWGDDQATKDAVRSDHEEAVSWYRTFREKGGSMESLSVEDTDSTESEVAPLSQRPPTHIPRESLRPDSRRFSQSYRQDFDSWTNFWDKHQVPEQDVPDVRARLGHLISLAGSWGMLKPKKGRKQHRHTRSGGSGNFFSQLSGHHRRSSSGATDTSVPISGSQGSPVCLPSQSSGSGHLPQEIPHQQRVIHQGHLKEGPAQQHTRTRSEAAASAIEGDNHVTAEGCWSGSGLLKPGARQDAHVLEEGSHGHKLGGRTRQVFKKMFSRNGKSFGSSEEVPDVTSADGHLHGR